MNCPRCPDAVLSITYRTGIELDFCPKCRGVWMDRGELDKVLERSELERISESDSRKSARPRDDGEDSRDRRAAEGSATNPAATSASPNGGAHGFPSSYELMRLGND